MCNDIFDKLSESELGIYVMTDSDADLVGRVKQIGYQSKKRVSQYRDTLFFFYLVLGFLTLSSKGKVSNCFLFSPQKALM